MSRKKLDITNYKFGRLTVKKDVGRNKKGEVLWQCDRPKGEDSKIIERN